MTGIPCSLDPLGSGLGVPFKPDFVVYEGRPQPAYGGQNNLNTTLKLYHGVYDLIIAGGVVTLHMGALMATPAGQAQHSKAG